MGTFPFTVVAMPLALWGVAGCAAASPVKTLVEGQTGTSGDDPRADTDALRKFATCRSAVFRLRRSQDGKGVGEASAHRAREATGTVTHGRGTSRRGTIWSGGFIGGGTHREGGLPMHQQTLPFTTGRYLRLIFAAILGLALSMQVAAAKECHRETPLPADVRLIAPGPEVPEAVARFAGVWTGEWEDSGGLCQTLVVEEVFANGYARVTSSVSTSTVLNIQLPGFWPATGRIVGGVLRFHGPGPDRPAFAYRVAGETANSPRPRPPEDPAID
jgi:hypothetical protein